jgi:hypothetical protein
VLVVGTDDRPGAELSLEIGQSTWSARSGEPGMAAISVAEPQRVRLVRVDGCVVLANFVADPGTSHTIRLDPAGEPRVGVRTTADEEAAPLERATEPSACQ